MTRTEQLIYENADLRERLKSQSEQIARIQDENAKMRNFIQMIKSYMRVKEPEAKRRLDCYIELQYNSASVEWEDVK